MDITNCFGTAGIACMTSSKRAQCSGTPPLWKENAWSVLKAGFDLCEMSSYSYQMGRCLVGHRGSSGLLVTSLGQGWCLSVWRSSLCWLPVSVT